MPKPKSGTKFFGFPLSKSEASTVYILGILLIIGTNLLFLWLLVDTIMYPQVYTSRSDAVMHIMPGVVIELLLSFLASYMIRIGRKGK